MKREPIFMEGFYLYPLFLKHLQYILNDGGLLNKEDGGFLNKGGPEESLEYRGAPFDLRLQE